MPMHDLKKLPPLDFPNVQYGASETPWNLNVLLYRGGANAPKDQVAKLITMAKLGEPQLDRLELVSKLHEEIISALASGHSRVTAASQILYLRYFFRFADSTHRPLTLESAVETYCAWADCLFHRTRIKKGTRKGTRTLDSQPLAMNSAYLYASTVGALLDRVLERHTGVVELTRLEHRKRRKTATGIQAEKQNLNDTFAFGHLLQNICDGLTTRITLEASLPIQIELGGGKTLTLAGYTGFHPRTEDPRLGTRYPLANLRIEAELLMFIAQTGMNRTQALNLELRHFFYVSHLKSYQVKDYKNRRGGLVLFEIFKEYKSHFERYLEWRRTLFPNSTRLFPFIGVRGSRPEARYSGHRIRAVCKQLSVPYICPRMLRRTRVNWLLRKSADPNITAEMAQHTKEILLTVYEQPSLQRAMVEAAHFWSKSDALSSKMQSVAPGDCTGQPKEAEDIPNQATKPNCINASGCLWCENHRDVDSFDYVWALMTFLHLKTIELSKASLPRSDEDVPPAKHAIDRAHDKLKWFEQSDEVRRGWVHEARARIIEGDFHPNFSCEIAELEGVA